MRGTVVKAARIVVALFFASAVAQADDGTDAAAVRQALTSWAEAFNTGDAERVCDLFAPDLIAVYQGVPDRNFADMCAHLRRILADPARRYSYSLDAKEILVADELVAARLVWTLQARDRNGNVVHTTQEPSLDLFRRQPDGQWRMARFLAFDINGP